MIIWLNPAWRFGAAPGSGVLMAAGIGSLLERATRGRRIKRHDRGRRAAFPLATFNIQYPAFIRLCPRYCLSLFSASSDRKPIRLFRFASHRIAPLPINKRSFAMPWIQLKLNTTGANAEELSDALMKGRRFHYLSGYARYAGFCRCRAKLWFRARYRCDRSVRRRNRHERRCRDSEQTSAVGCRICP